MRHRGPSDRIGVMGRLGHFCSMVDTHWGLARTIRELHYTMCSPCAAGIADRRQHQSPHWTSIYRTVGRAFFTLTFHPEFAMSKASTTFQHNIGCPSDRPRIDTTANHNHKTAAGHPLCFILAYSTKFFFFSRSLQSLVQYHFPKKSLSTSSCS